MKQLLTVIFILLISVSLANGDAKISADPSATLTGTETIPVVQSSVNKTTTPNDILTLRIIQAGANNILTYTGNYSLGFTLTGNTSVTLPTTGTLMKTTDTAANSAQLDGHAAAYFQTALTNPITGTSTNHYWPYFTGSTTQSGKAITASKPVCSDASGDPTVCAGTEGVWQPAAANLTTYAGITPSANVQSLLGATNYSAMRTLLSLGSLATLSSAGPTNMSASDFGDFTCNGTTCTLDASYLTTSNISDAAYSSDWNNVNGVSPSQNAVYDEFVAVIAALPTASSLHMDDILTALGIASEATHFGAFTGSTIADNQTAKAAIQALETAVEGKVSTSSAASYTEPVSNLPLCRTGAGTIGGCTNVTDVAFSSYAPIANPQFTGVVDIPSGATTDAEGEITIDTTSDQFRYYGSAQKVLPSVQYASFVIPAPVDTDDILVMKAPYGMTLTGVDCIVQGTTSITGQLQECDSAGANCADTDADIVCDADGAAADGTFTNGVIDSGDWILWKSTSASGTPTFLTVTFKYLVVAD